MNSIFCGCWFRHVNKLFFILFFIYSESYVKLVCNRKVLPGQEYMKAIGKAKHAESRYVSKRESARVMWHQIQLHAIKKSIT